MTEFQIIDLDEFFFQISDEIYCIIKLDRKFPFYKSGDDIDIFCYDIISLSQKILKIGNKYVNNGYEIKITNSPFYLHIYVDFFLNDNLEFRFDLYGVLPYYKNIRIKPALFSSIIENAIPQKRMFQNQEYNIFVPNEIDEMLIRYIEYIEWYNQRPDKIKHLDYILDNSDNNRRIRVFDKIHYYTELPPIESLTIKRQEKVSERILDIKPFKQIIHSRFSEKLIIKPFRYLKTHILK